MPTALDKGAGIEKIDAPVRARQSDVKDTDIDCGHIEIR